MVLAKAVSAFSDLDLSIVRVGERKRWAVTLPHPR
jgi:hypothetical protein